MKKRNEGQQAERFLRDTAYSPMHFGTMTYPTLHHAYLAIQVMDPQLQARIQTASLADAENLTRFAPCPFEVQETPIYRQLVWCKFRNPRLVRKLLETDAAKIPPAIFRIRKNLERMAEGMKQLSSLPQGGTP